MSHTKLADASLDAKKLLAMPVSQAEMVFQSYSMEQQLGLILSTPDPKAREELYYLVPDCTELIQNSPTEDVLQVLSTMLGTGLASVWLPYLSADQFEEAIDLAVWRNGQLDEKALDLWLFELSECDTDELGEMLSHMDIGLIANLLGTRVTFKTNFQALFAEAGVVDPSSMGIEYADERAKAILDAIWVADDEFFIRLLYEMLAINQPEKKAVIAKHLQAAIVRAQEQRSERVQERDQATGIHVTEEEILERADLDNLELDEDSEDEDEGDDVRD